MSEQERQDKGKQILEALAMAGKKESLSSKVKEQEIRISDNNNRVIELQKEVDADNTLAQTSIKTLSAELDGITKELETSLASLEKEGYKLPIGKKTSRTISL